MGIPLPPPGGGGGDPQDPGLTCAEAKANIASLTLTLANLTSLLARTTDPTQRADIQAGIRQAQEELAVLRAQLPIVCGPPPPPPVEPTPVLIVLDGLDASFADTPTPTDSYFTLTHFLSVMRAQAQANPLRPITLTLAHRQNDAHAAPGTVINNAYFTWQSSTVPGTVPNGSAKHAVNLSAFRVVFLFGFVSMNPDCLAWDADANGGESQLWAFSQFMNTGGGLFAAGDHEDLGAPLCAAIPRVRSMRRWLWQPGTFTSAGGGEGVSQGPGQTGYGFNYASNAELQHPFNTSQGASLGMRCAPPALGPLRHDTLQGPLEIVPDPNAGATEVGIPFDRQSDDVPQPIQVVTPHQIFALPGGGQLAVFPDHMHEGMTIDLSDTTNPNPNTVTYTHQGVTIDEYPRITGQSPPVPQVVVQLTTTGGHGTPSSETAHGGALDPTSGPVTFGGVSVYDGTPVGVGRIVTDSTFHHFVDINVIGDLASNAGGDIIVSSQAPDNGIRAGFTTSNGQQFLAQFGQYWVNLVTWLANPVSAMPLLMAAVNQARQSVTVRMSAGTGVAEHGEAVHDLGEIVVQFIDRLIPAALLRDALQQAMPAAHAQGVADWLAGNPSGQPDVAAEVDRVLLHGFMGGAVLHGLGLPREQNLAADAEAVAHQVVHAGLKGAAKALAASGHNDVAQDLIALLAETVLA